VLQDASGLGLVGGASACMAGVRGEVLWNARGGGQVGRALACGGGVRQGVHWAVGVWREVNLDSRGRGLVGGASGRKRQELGRRCLSMQAAWVWWEVLQLAWQESGGSCFWMRAVGVRRAVHQGGRDQAAGASCGGGQVGGGLRVAGGRREVHEEAGSGVRRAVCRVMVGGGLAGCASGFARWGSSGKCLWM
jgi:hypothetical protein